MDDLPNLPHVVRDKDGEAIATYADKRPANEHAAREPGSTVTYDHHAAQFPDPKRQPKE